MLYFDKNKLMGVEVVFKLIGEVFGVLLDKMKRYLYDLKWGGEFKVF